MNNLKIALVCISKNEENYLREWIEYHLRLGFSEIFIYQNNWRYPLEPLDDPRVHMLVMDGITMQNKCYDSFIQENSTYFDFAAFIDVDEFLVPTTGESLERILEDYVNEDCIYINWRIFGDNGHKFVENGDYSCIKRFTKCAVNLHRLGKNILNFRKNGNRYSFYNPHIALIDKKTCICSDSNQEFHTQNIWDHIPESGQRLELFHFKNKTLPELINRKYLMGDAVFERGNPVYMNLSSLLKDFEEMNHNELENKILLEMMYQTPPSN